MPTTDTHAQVLRTAALALAGTLAGHAHAQSLFGVTFEGELVRVDAATGNVESIGDTGVDRLAGRSRAADGTLYAYDAPAPGAAAALYTINAATGAATTIGALGVGFEFEGGLVVADAQTAFAIGGRDTDAGAGLFRIDLATGAATELGSLGTPDINGLTLRSDGSLVAWTQLGGQLLAIAPDTVAVTPIAVNSAFNGAFGGMASANGQTAFVTASGFGSTGSIFSVDLFTGEGGGFVSLSDGVQLSGLAIPAPGAIPLLLGAAALVARRRRNA